MIQAIEVCRLSMRLGCRPASDASVTRHLYASAHLSICRRSAPRQRVLDRSDTVRGIVQELPWPEQRVLTNKVYGFCGDIGRGRTVRSLASLLGNYEGVTLIFIAPNDPTLALHEDLRGHLLDRSVKIYEVESFNDTVEGVPVIESLDALYMTRIQKEHNAPGDDEKFAALDLSRYKLSTELVARMKDYAPILHPFPRDQHFGEIPHEIDNDPRAMYFRQARNGMWIRAALLASVFDVDHQISVTSTTK